LLAKSNFKEGMVAGLPQGIKLVHKFGEGGDVNGELQLHETGIIYMPGGPYLITIMTKGNDLQQLAAIIAALTKTTYNGLVRINDNHQTAM
jgi:beta-lactamase class A